MAVKRSLHGATWELPLLRYLQIFPREDPYSSRSNKKAPHPPCPTLPHVLKRTPQRQKTAQWAQIAQTGGCHSLKAAHGNVCGRRAQIPGKINRCCVNAESAQSKGLSKDLDLWGRDLIKGTFQSRRHCTRQGLHVTLWIIHIATLVISNQKRNFRIYSKLLRCHCMEIHTANSVVLTICVSVNWALLLASWVLSKRTLPGVNKYSGWIMEAANPQIQYLVLQLDVCHLLREAISPSDEAQKPGAQRT